MPLFEYQCLECRNIFESLELAGRETKASCPKCGGTKIEKKISVFSAHSSTQKTGTKDFSCGSCPNAENGSCCPGD